MTHLQFRGWSVNTPNALMWVLKWRITVNKTPEWPFFSSPGCSTCSLNKTRFSTCKPRCRGGAEGVERRRIGLCSSSGSSAVLITDLSGNKSTPSATRPNGCPERLCGGSRKAPIIIIYWMAVKLKILTLHTWLIQFINCKRLQFCLGGRSWFPFLERRSCESPVCMSAQSLAAFIEAE